LFVQACKPGTPPVSVVVTDTCASCAAEDLSLQALTFDLLADMSVGRVNVTYTEVRSCTVSRKRDGEVGYEKGAT
jgi:expansin (peptidoglycan-binding protein)